MADDDRQAVIALARDLLERIQALPDGGGEHLGRMADAIETGLWRLDGSPPPPNT